jgi:hypothetical protein
MHSVRSHRTRYILELLLASILESYLQLTAHLLMRGIRDVDAARLGDAFQTGGYIDTIAQDVVTFDQHVAKIDTDSEQHPPILRHVSVPFRHELLDRNGALHGGHDGRKLEEDAVAGGLDNASAIARHDRIDGGTVLAQSPCCADLIGTHQAAVTGDISRQDGC